MPAVADLTALDREVIGVDAGRPRPGERDGDHPFADRLAIAAPDTADLKSIIAQLVRTLAEAASSHADGSGPSPRALDAVRRSGVLALVVPSEHGGLGRDAVAANRVVMDVARVDPSTAIILFQHFAVTARIADWGTPEQARRMLPRAASGEWILASAWSETGAGADKKRLATHAHRQPDGSWVLDGAKSFTTGAGVAQLYLVLAQSGETGYEPAGYGAAGQTFFLVPATNPGLVPDVGMDLAGMRRSATGFVQLRACHVGADAVLGPVGEAPRIIATVRESGVSLGAVSVGIAQAAYDIAVNHAATRRLLSHQAVRHRLVDMATRIEAARAIVERAGRRDSSAPGTTTLHSKLFASEACESVVLDASRLLGSAGFIGSHPINRLSSDGRAVGLMGPTNDLCRELVSTRWTV